LYVYLMDSRLPSLRYSPPELVFCSGNDVCLRVNKPFPSTGASFDYIYDFFSSDEFWRAVDVVADYVSDTFFGSDDVLSLGSLTVDSISRVEVRTPRGKIEGSAWVEGDFVCVGLPRGPYVELDVGGGMTWEGMHGFVRHLLESNTGEVSVMGRGVFFVPDPERAGDMAVDAYDKYLLSVISDAVAESVRSFGGECTRSKTGDAYVVCRVPVSDRTEIVFYLR